MKITKQQLQKIIQEELSAMQQEGEVDEALGTFLSTLGKGAADVARSAATGISGTISAAKEASKKADEEAAKAKEEAKLAAEKVKTSADVEAVIGTALKQVKGTIESLNTLVKKMGELKMPVSEAGLDLPMILQQLKTAGTALYHGGKKAKELKGGVQGFETATKGRESPLDRGGFEARRKRLGEEENTEE